MVKVVIDAGHGIGTSGKRTPDGEREWVFNDKVVRAAIAKLMTYEGVQILRVDDETGKVDAPLAARTNQANLYKGDVYVSVHHNALAGKWGSHGGIETYTFDHPDANPKSRELAAKVHPKIVKAMGLRDRGLKLGNYQVLRATNMPAILTEGGFMDSTTDISALRDDKRLKAQGEAIAEGLADYFNLKAKTASKSINVQYRVKTGTFKTKADAEKAATAIKKQFGWVVYVAEETY